MTMMPPIKVENFVDEKEQHGGINLKP